ncbi:hypothetical protein [Mesorhizobium captivum]|uniref:hypothetical protein n=1 Tax=Mesorhizobium captivum TaxID=3072319 RepID=UPI002A24AF6B|nr:hypothetical protein [Mesorhizobium sp. VK3C]MDX8450594.1 hypothetical protein [Mesorhizobium sp. VK3C]
MKYFINDDLALSRPPEGPVAIYIVPFAEWLGDRGYGLVSMRNQVLMAAGFSTWLRQQGIELSDVSEEYAERYLLDRAQRPKRGDGTALRHLLAFLRRQNAIAEEKPSTTRHRLNNMCLHTSGICKSTCAVSSNDHKLWASRLRPRFFQLSLQRW